MKTKNRLVLSILVATCAISAHAADLPNIVLVMADDQGWGDTAYNGHPVLETPHLDAMAQAGLRFDHFYAAAPVCVARLAVEVAARDKRA